MSVLISVVIPTYNHAEFLARALQSVRNQTYPYWEAVVVDNHSHDNTDQVVENCRDPRVRLFKIHNQGVIAASRNLGINNAKGEWIAFLDADDRWYPARLDTLVRAIKSHVRYDVVSSDEMLINIHTGAKRVLRYGPAEKDLYKALLVEGNRLSTSATMVRRRFLVDHALRFDESKDHVTVEDYGLWLELARCGARFKFIREIHGEYVIHQANESAQLSRHGENLESLLRHHVFNVQQFQPLKNKLWKQIYPRLRSLQIREALADRHIRTAVRLTLGTILDYPEGSAVYLRSALKRLLRRTIG